MTTVPLRPPSPVLPYEDIRRRPIGRALRCAIVATWLYPLLPAAMLNLTWFTAWAVLGHQPRPSLDDPKQIGHLIDIPYVVSFLLTATSPIGAFLGATIGSALTAMAARSCGVGPRRAALLIATLVLLYAASLVLLYADPLHVLEWYMD